MSRHLALLGLALAFVVAPALGVAALEVCPPCCEHASSAPCEEGAAPCTALAAGACCEAAPASQAQIAKRAPEAPPLDASDVARAVVPSAIPARIPADRGDIRWWTRPSRLSVVRRL